MERFIEYAPIILVVIIFLCNYQIFITPAQLEKRLAEIKSEAEKKYAHKEATDIIITGLKEDVSEMKTKIDIIYNKIMGIKQ